MCVLRCHINFQLDIASRAVLLSQPSGSRPGQSDPALLHKGPCLTKNLRRAEPGLSKTVTALAAACALSLAGCVDGPVGVAPSASAGYAGDGGALSPVAPTLRAALAAPPAATEAAVTACAPAAGAETGPLEVVPAITRARFVSVPLPTPRPAEFAAGETSGVSQEAKAAPAPSALPVISALTLINPEPAAPARPRTQLASLFVEGARLPLPAGEAQGNGAVIETQTGRVDTSCFPTSLKDVLADIGRHFGGPVVVTSGYRSAGENRHAGGARHSYHVKCLAADIQIGGIAPGDIARYARSLEAVGGVGRYGHTKSVHVDVGERKFSWYGLHRRHRRS